MAFGPRMRRRIAIWLAACLILVSAEAPGRAFRVRRIRGNRNSATWGTDEFEVTVNSLGVMRHVKVKGLELVWQAAALYTSPVPPGAKRGLRTVQGEGVGTRGLTVERPRMTTREEGGARVFEFEHYVANKKVLGGRRLCKVTQKLMIRPTGEIHVSYDFEWLHTLRWGSFMLLPMFQAKTCRDREYMILAGERVFTGRLEKGPVTQRRLRHIAFKQLTVRSDVGPFHFVWDTENKCSFHWGGGIQLSITPKSVPYRGVVYKGQKDRIAYRILLPVSQQ